MARPTGPRRETLWPRTAPACGGRFLSANDHMKHVTHGATHGQKMKENHAEKIKDLYYSPCRYCVATVLCPPPPPPL